MWALIFLLLKMLFKLFLNLAIVFMDKIYQYKVNIKNIWFKFRIIDLILLILWFKYYSYFIKLNYKINKF